MATPSVAQVKTNKEKIAAKERAYREANKEKIAAKKRTYREANKEKVAADTPQLAIALAVIEGTAT